jgi:C-terminal processing protease CtpA/Prc
MSSSRWCRKGCVFVALVGATLGLAYPVGAQNTPAPGADTANRNKFRARLATGVAAGDLVGYVDDVLVATAQDQADELLGAALQPVGDVLRSQLEVPAGQGLLVASLRADGPSARAGLKSNDILLTLADKPLAAAEDLGKHLKAAGEAAVPLKVLRAGKPLTIQVRPVYRVTLGPAAQQKTEYYIGVSIEGADDALRTQLALPAGQGVVITDVQGGSPAEKAGVRKNDVVLELGGKPVDSPENLAKEVQANQEKPTTLKILRGGKPVVIPVTAATRTVDADRIAAAVQLSLINLAEAQLAKKADDQIRREDLQQRLDQLEKEMQAIRAALDKINETLKTGKQD